MRRRVRSEKASGRGGWTLLEIVISTVILLLVVVGFSYGLASSTSLQRVTRDHGIAREVARATIEELRSAPFDQILARYDDDETNDIPGVSPGPHFEVLGLAPQPNDADGFVGEIVFPIVAGELREDLEEQRLGMPRDLTGDGNVDDIDHWTDKRLLPVLVRLRWRGAGGDASFELLTLVKGPPPPAPEP